MRRTLSLCLPVFGAALLAACSSVPSESRLANARGQESAAWAESARAAADAEHENTMRREQALDEMTERKAQAVISPPQ